MKSTTLALVAALATSLGLSAPAQAAATFVNGLALPGSALDVSGGTSVNDGRMGYFSDLYYDANRSEWWGLSDRGPGGGTLSYDTRVQRFTLDINATTGAISNFQVVQTVKFTTASGQAFNGIAPNPSSTLGGSFDPEGLVINPRNGNFLVSDEYGPSLYEFNRSGQLVRTFSTPSNLIPRNAATGVANHAGDAGNTAGKRTNRGFEGLAVSPNGQFAFAMLQSAMLDEGGADGVYNRIVKFDLSTGAVAGQYAYKMEGSSQGRGISALVAINDHEFDVLERNNRGVGVPEANLAAPNKKVFRIDIDGATDVSEIDLDAPGASFTEVSKTATPVVDLATDTLSELGNVSPEKWEGWAIGPKLADGTYLMLAGTDNDYSITQNASGEQFEVFIKAGVGTVTRIQCDIGTFNNCKSIGGNGLVGVALPTGTDFTGYTAIPGVLHAYKSGLGDMTNYVQAVPEPETIALLGAGLAVMTWVRRRR
ncbi:MAG: esterase-like activity of phytase family protein [Aquabacterium sp.]|uniref:esterase-like activity of phytase family protein n=1 Tax=Aquabacterium sp. TaxID=1872578 RepID=UPI0027214085|nr:esterase-like activity of phytase family protein [Aquabacterium sp.]MDO9006365.1 esterase-like activity of phytase family protein [Aquabacterium sp.]